MELKTERIYLRPIEEGDTEMVLRWRNSPDVKKYFIYREDITPEEHGRWLEEKVKTGKVAQFIIYLREGNIPVGSVYMQSIDHKHKNAEYGIFIGEAAARGHGCGTDAARLAVYVHGLAGDIAANEKGQIALVAGDIVDCLPRAWRSLEEECVR
jgi:RimJ/RimL family protein N-acetyltransferase